MTHLSIVDVDSGRVEPVVPLPRLYDQRGRTVALSADGRTVVYVQSQSDGNIWMALSGN